jgi:very-short-patch-repair endonuclease
MKRLLRLARLPPAMTNVRLAGVEPDFLWPQHRLVVELDGLQFHGHRAAFERDRRKELVLPAAGYQVIRISWRQLTEEPLMVAATLAAALLGSRLRD